MGVIENRIDITELERSGGGGGGTAASVTYDNTTSHMTATDVQAALDELNLDIAEGLALVNTSVAANSAAILEKAGKDQISNRNLLDNGWFTVNQRGQNAYSNTGLDEVYTVDRWSMIGFENETVSFGVDNSGITFNAGVNAFRQKLYDIWDTLIGKVLTLSIEYTAAAASGQVGIVKGNAWDDNTIINFKVGHNIDSVSFTAESGTNASLWVNIPAANTNFNIKAVKLEVGAISTLDMDAAPNYAEELLKCQRYFVRYKRTDANAMEYGLMVASTATSAHGIVNLPTSMRATPSIVVPDATKLSLYGQYKYSLTALSIALCDDQNTIVKLTATTSGMTEGAAYMLQADTGYGFDFSADL